MSTAELLNIIDAELVKRYTVDDIARTIRRLQQVYGEIRSGVTFTNPPAGTPARMIPIPDTAKHVNVRMVEILEAEQRREPQYIDGIVIPLCNNFNDSYGKMMATAALHCRKVAEGGAAQGDPTQGDATQGTHNV
jgi:hypothetical protein